MFRMIEKEGVKLLVSDKIISRHGFSTRLGGFSTSAHTSSLNLAYGLGDDEETVKRNVEAFASALGVDARKIISVPQIHSADVRTVYDADAGAGVWSEAAFKCDGYVTVCRELPIGIKTADCVPILIEGRDERGIPIAVSAIHAGWRGTAAKIAAVAIEKMAEFGVKKENVYVAIGPCIGECCYEVGIDFANEINKKLGQNYENKHIKRSENGSLFADLVGMNIDILVSCGAVRDNIDVCSLCTYCEEDLFYSHRRQKGIRGSMMSVICL